MAGELLQERRDHVAYLTLNRPEQRNALNAPLRSQLIEALVDANEDADVFAIVITGAGDRAFCAGGDIKEFNEIAKRGGRFPTPMSGAYRNVHEVILETYKPTIAALNGPAVAGGCEVALACDLRIAADHAVIGLPEAKVGMGANAGSVLLPRMLPRAVAYQMLYTGEPLSPLEALQWGLVNQVVPRDELMSATEALVRKIVANAPVTIRRFKEMAAKSWGVPVATALRLNVGPSPYLSEDREEGIRARLERRKPEWKNR